MLDLPLMLLPAKLRLLLVLPVLLAIASPAMLTAQDDPNDLPLGDVARSLRKKTPSSQDVIDDDNLSKIMSEAESRHAPGSALKFLMTGEGKGFQVAAPDVTCSLSFSGNVKSLLSGQYDQMELPPREVVKLEGPAAIEGDALTVSVFNGTDWHVSEVAVALTVVKRAGARDASLSGSWVSDGKTAKFVPAVAESVPQESEVRPEKKPDVTVIYRMRAAAPPLTTTVFSAPLNLDLAPDEEWHWAIVQAKGYPPQSSTTTPQTTAQTGGPAKPVTVPSSLTVPLEDPPSVPLPQHPQ